MAVEKLSYSVILPHCTRADYLAMWADPAYQQSMAQVAKMQRTNMQLQLGEGLQPTRSQWTATVTFGLKQPQFRLLRPAFPNGITLAWNESHSICPSQGDRWNLTITQPSLVANKIVVEGTSRLEEVDGGLRRTIDFGLDLSAAPFLLRRSGLASVVAAQIGAGQQRASAATAAWLTAKHAAKTQQSAVPAAKLPEVTLADCVAMRAKKLAEFSSDTAHTSASTAASFHSARSRQPRLGLRRYICCLGGGAA